MVTVVVAIAEKGHESAQLVAACRALAARQLDKVPGVGLLAVAIAATKSGALSACVGRIAETAGPQLGAWPAADTIRLLLAVMKAKGEPLASQLRGTLMRQTATAISPHLGELPAAELIRLALAAGSA